MGFLALGSSLDGLGRDGEMQGVQGLPLSTGYCVCL